MTKSPADKAELDDLEHLLRYAMQANGSYQFAAPITANVPETDSDV